jgi:hypothetical protein
MLSVYQPKPLDLSKFASINATNASAHLSERYGFISTAEIVQHMQAAGFTAVRASETRVRLEERAGFAKHIIRFRHADITAKIGDNIPEIVIVNSHDGSSAYKIMAGVYRLVCTNGFIVGETLQSYAVRHTKNAPDDVIDASFKIIKALPEVQDSIETMQHMGLNPEERQVFARAALELRYTPDQAEPAPITPQSLLTPRRYADQKNDLWTTFNTVQEHIIKGGTRRADQPRRKTRKVSSITEDVRLNRALWTLAEEMRKLKP